MGNEQQARPIPPAAGPAGGAGEGGAAGHAPRRASPARHYIDIDYLLGEIAALVRRLPELPLSLAQRRDAKAIRDELSRRVRHYTEEV